MTPNQTFALAEVKTLSFDFPESHKLAKAEALADARGVLKVGNHFEMSLCMNAMTLLKERRDFVGEWRKRCKRPIIDLGKLVEDVAEREAAELNDEYARLQLLGSAFQAEQDRIARDAEAKRRDELAKIERERLAKEQEAQRKADAERKVKEDEARRKADAERAAAKTEQDRIDAERRAKAEADRIALENEQATAARVRDIERDRDEATKRVMLSTPMLVKVEGQTVNRPWKFRVTDLAALYAARPELVLLTERTAEINARMRAGERSIAGLEIYQDCSVGVRV